jgi:hypothetical protein
MRRIRSLPATRTRLSRQFADDVIIAVSARLGAGRERGQVRAEVDLAMVRLGIADRQAAELRGAGVPIKTRGSVLDRLSRELSDSG